MQKMMMLACVAAIAAVGLGVVMCTFACFWARLKRLAIWRMPKGILAALALVSFIATVVAQKGELVPAVPRDMYEESASLAYWSTLDSADAITEPAVGQAGICSEAIFVKGKVGMALSVPAGSSVASIPLPNGLPRERGCIEFWAKLEGDKESFAAGGDPMFVHISPMSSSDHFGWIEFNADNGDYKRGLGAKLPGVDIYSGSYGGPTTYSSILSDVDGWHHYALVWNICDSLWHLNGCPAFALLLDGVPVAQAGYDGNFDRNGFVANMSIPLRLDLSCSDSSMGKSAYLIDELRIWDWDLTMFSSYLENPAVRYVDAKAYGGGLGISWSSAARSIEEACRNMIGGTIYVKPGLYGAFSYKKPPEDGMLAIVATGAPGETVVDGAGTGAIANGSGEPPTRPELRLDGITVRNIGTRLQGIEFDRCVVSNFTHGVASASSFANCLVVANSSVAGEQLFESCSFANCTVASNSPVEGSLLGGCRAINTIFWDNGALGYEGLHATNCCVEGGILGLYNIAEDPKFADVSSGDWRLASDSPCIDAGDDAVARGEYDLEGRSRILGEHVDIGAYESLPSPATARLVYHNTLDSADAVIHPAIGAYGTCNDATFVDGKIGSALYVPANSNVATLPLPDGLPAEKGCIEFWAKLEDGKTSYVDGGDPIFMRIYRDTDALRLFSFEYNANNGGGRGGLIASMLGLTIAPEGWSISKDFSKYITKGDVSDWHHYAYVWNVDGIDSLDGTPRSVILVDGDVVAQSDGDGSLNKVGFLNIMNTPLHIVFSAASASNGKSPFAIDELKIWDADKTKLHGSACHHSVSYVYDGMAHTLQPATGGVGDEVFRYSLSPEGPFVEEMPTLTDAGSICVWYQVEAEGESIVSSATITVKKRTLVFRSANAEKQYDGTSLSITNVVVTGNRVDGEDFSFEVTGSRTAVGESDNTFTWSANEGTNPDNYNIKVIFGKLKVTIGQVEEGIAYDVVRTESGNGAVRITGLSYPDGGDVTLPKTLGGAPVIEVVAGALAGTGVTSVRVPAGVSAVGALFDNLAQLTNVTFDAGSTVTSALSFRGSEALREVVLPASVEALEPHAFLGCWALERVVFAGAPPFGNDNVDRPTDVNLVTASVRPATLLQMADMICYPADSAAKWEKSLRNLGYGGRYGAYVGEWAGEESLVLGTGNLAEPVPTVVTNVIVTVITNVLVPPVPAEQPSAQYAAQAGTASGEMLAGAVGWDMFGLPDGMTWDRDTGTLGGTPTKSGTYDVILVSGSGADTKIMRTTIEVAGYAATTGYVGVAFSASGAPWSCLSSYKNLPAGLTWKNNILSGSPSKAGTYSYKTVADEPVTLEILAPPDTAVGTYNGIMVDGTSRERFPLKVSTTAAGKVSATVTKGTKNYSLSASKWSNVTVENVNGVPHRIFSATLTANGLSLSVKVDVDLPWNADALTAVGTSGAVDGLAGTAQRNAFAADDAAKACATERAGSYSLAAAPDGANGWILASPAAGAKGELTLSLKATGAATLSGTLPDKTRVSASSTLYVDGDGIATLRFYVKGTWIVWNPDDLP